jgi:RNA polymerase sigma factor (sigma-70 family)
MANGQADILWRHLCDLVDERRAADGTDSQLLQQFATGHDEAAFEALVRRHGPLVLSVCRRALHDWHAAEDAFQATFLILARKAASIRKQTSLASWLYGVAHRVALKARAKAIRGQVCERAAEMARVGDPLEEVTGRELLTVLDEELQRLPERYRAPLVLCYLNGHTRDEAAHELGWSLGTLKRRLEQGKARLRTRLARRGLALSAALLATSLAQQTAKAVPASLVRAASGAAGAATSGLTGLASYPAALAEAVLHASAMTRLKHVAALLLLLGVLGSGVAALTARLWPANAELVADTDRAAAGQQKRAPGSRPQPRAEAAAADGKASTEDNGRKQTVTGRVVDDTGHALAHADVAVLGELVLPTDHPAWRLVPLAQGKSDHDGRFRLIVPRQPAARGWGTYLLARLAGHALAMRELGGSTTAAEPERRDVEIALLPERIVRGRLVDLQGQAAAHVRLGVNGFQEPEAKDEYVHDWSGSGDPQPDVDCWPPSVTTDDQGRFVLRGVGRRWTVSLLVEDKRFAPQELTIHPEGKGPGGLVAVSVAPARVMAGTVSYADTGRPAAGARLTIICCPAARGSVARWMYTRTDGQGRFRVSPYGDPQFFITAHPPAGQPYVHVKEQEVEWPKGKLVLQGVSIVLPRGALVRGRATEQPSGKPVVGASIQYAPLIAKNPAAERTQFGHLGQIVTSGEDGRFQLGILPGPGHVLINGPTPDYGHQESNAERLYGPGRRNYRYYADAIVPVNVKASGPPADLTVTLRRGVTVRGRLTGPQGQKVDQAVMWCASGFAPPEYAHSWADRRLVQAGNFEVRTCDPDKVEPVFFMDLEHPWGAVVRISGKQAGKPLTVRLQPCGSVRARFVNQKGEPVPKLDAAQMVEVVVAAGIPWQEAEKSTGLVGVTLPLAYTTWKGTRSLPTDAEGRVVLRPLIPGATFKVLVQGRKSLETARQFTVKARETVDLKDIVTRTKP